MKTQVTEECVLLDNSSLAYSREDVDYAVAPVMGRGGDVDDFCCCDLSRLRGWTVTASSGGRHLPRGAGKPGWDVSTAGLQVLVYFAHLGPKGVLVHAASRGSGDTGPLVGASEFKLENHR